MKLAPRALLDTSVLIDPPENLVDYVNSAAISTITLAELAYGLHTPSDPLQVAAREIRYQRITEAFDPIPYSATAARLYGALCASVRISGRDPRPRRFDLLIASIAAAENIPLLTRNPKNFDNINSALQVIPITAES